MKTRNVKRPDVNVKVVNTLLIWPARIPKAAKRAKARVARVAKVEKGKVEKEEKATQRTSDGDATSGEGKSGVKRESGDVTEAITSMAKKIKAYKKLGDGDAKAAAKQTLEATFRKFFMFKKLKTRSCKCTRCRSTSVGVEEPPQKRRKRRTHGC